MSHPPATRRSLPVRQRLAQRHGAPEGAVRPGTALAQARCRIGTPPLARSSAPRADRPERSQAPLRARCPAALRSTAALLAAPPKPRRAARARPEADPPMRLGAPLRARRPGALRSTSLAAPPKRQPAARARQEADPPVRWQARLRARCPGGRLSTAAPLPDCRRAHALRHPQTTVRRRSARSERPPGKVEVSLPEADLERSGPKGGRRRQRIGAHRPQRTDVARSDEGVELLQCVDDL